MSNMTIWDALKTPPDTALRKINFGPLKGKSDISPQWRYQVMTEQFGPCGIGWKWEVVERWTEDAPSDTRNGTRAVFVRVHLFIKDGDKWSEAIDGLGGSMLIEKDKNGTKINDEAYKMATTDAIGCALKMVGVAADVYLGNMDGSKNQPRNTQPSEAAHAGNENMARQLVKSYKVKIDADPQVRGWVDGAMKDGYYTDVVNHLKERFTPTQGDKK